MKNFLSINFLYLINKLNCSQDEFGSLFDLKRGNINQYIREVSVPKLETLQKIAVHFKISLDDLVNVDLSQGQTLKAANDGIAAEPQILSYGGSENVIADLHTKISMQAELITTQKELIESQKDIIGNLKGQLSQAS